MGSGGVNLEMSYEQRRREMMVLSLACLIICFQLSLVMLHWLCIKVQLNINQIGFNLTNQVAVSFTHLHLHLTSFSFFYLSLTRGNISSLTYGIYVKYDILPFLFSLSPFLLTSRFLRWCYTQTQQQLLWVQVYVLMFGVKQPRFLLCIFFAWIWLEWLSRLDTWNEHQKLSLDDWIKAVF